MKAICFHTIFVIYVSLELAPVRALDSSTEAEKISEPTEYRSKRDDQEKGTSNHKPWTNVSDSEGFHQYPTTSATLPPTQADSQLSNEEANGTRCPEQLKNITYNFSNMWIETFNPDIIETSDIVSLNLSNNRIATIAPGTFKRLPNLQVLDLSGNILTLRDMLNNRYMKNLVSLYIDDYKLFYRPVNNSKVDDVPFEFPIFPKLKILSLRNSPNRPFHLGLKQLAPQLTHLYLSHNSIRATEFLLQAPETLSHLYLDDNRISSIPKTALENIVELSVAQNDIDVLCFNDCPASSFSLDNAKKLESLNVSGNNIRSIILPKETYPSLLSLKRLDLAGNELSEVPYQLESFSSLEHLVLNHNRLESVPNLCSWQSLKSLDLSHNDISTLKPGFLCNHKSLEKLKLARNHIRYITAGTFADPGALLDLDLSENYFIKLPQAWIDASNRLKILRLRNSFIRDLDQVALQDIDGLTELHLEGNRLCRFSTASLANLRANFTIYLHDLPIEQW